LELTLPALFITKKMAKDNFVNKIKRGVSLKKNNTMGIECIAEYFLEAKSGDDVFYGVNYAEKNGLPFFILGKGSNIILPPRYRGVVIYMGMESFSLEVKKDVVLLSAMAGAFLPDVAYEVTKKGGAGMEWAGGVPGSVGGAIRGNAGAFDDFTSDYIKRVKALDIKKNEERHFMREECEFAYRESVFKKNRNYIVLEGEMEFPKKEGTEKKFQEYLEYRKKRHPQKPSAGSVFKNPEVKEDFFRKHKNTEKFRKLGFVPVGFLIKECGLNGRMEGGAQISEKHPNFIINKKGATKEDVENLTNIVKGKIKEKFGVDVETEVDFTVV